MTVITKDDDQMKFLRRIWNDIRSGENIDLYITAFAAISLAALNLLGVASPSLIAPLILAVLGLLAISSLVTRQRLEELPMRLTTLQGSFLKGRPELPSFEARGQDVSEIVIVGVSLISAIVPNLKFFEQKMEAGCKLRFLLLDPSSSSLETWNLINKIQSVRKDIELCLESLEILIQMERTTKGRCEVRLANVFLPFSIGIFNPSRKTGFMTIELAAYKKALGDRPHFRLNRAQDEKWFEFFKNQYEQLWADSKEWRSSTVQ